jgi:hypothetical protein
MPGYVLKFESQQLLERLQYHDGAKACAGRQVLGWTLALSL